MTDTSWGFAFRGSNLISTAASAGEVVGYPNYNSERPLQLRQEPSPLPISKKLRMSEQETKVNNKNKIVKQQKLQ